MATHKKTNNLPGFGIAAGYTVFWLSLIVLIPLAALALRSVSMGPVAFWHAIASPRVLASLKVSFGTAAAAAGFNVFFGLLVAWVLVRYTFPGKKLADALIDLPFALPTAVAGIALTTLYAPKGWLGSLLEPLGIKVAYTPLGITIALIFIGLPFVVRTVQPVLEDFDAEIEEAAESLGAKPWQTFWRVLLPGLLPSLLAGFAMSFARCVGEYGSVVFISGNLPMKTEITPLLIMTKLEQYDYAGAAALGMLMLGISFSTLLVLNLVQKWSARGITA